MTEVNGFKVPMIVSLYNHGFNALFCFLEFISIEHTNIESFFWKSKVFLFACLAYFVLQHLCKKITGETVYPFLEKLNLSQVATGHFMSFIILLILERGSYLLIPLKRENNFFKNLHSRDL